MSFTKEEIITSNEIKKALECCNTKLEDYQCPHCPLLHKGCKKALIQNVLDLINRLQTENKDKEALLNHQGETIKTLENVIKNTFLKNAGLDIDPLAEIKAEAYKECIEKVKEKAEKETWCSGGELKVYRYTILAENLDNLLKEIVSNQRKEDESNG